MCFVYWGILLYFESLFVFLINLQNMSYLEYNYLKVLFNKYLLLFLVTHKVYFTFTQVNKLFISIKKVIKWVLRFPLNPNKKYLFRKVCSCYRCFKKVRFEKKTKIFKMLSKMCAKMFRSAWWLLLNTKCQWNIMFVNTTNLRSKHSTPQQLQLKFVIRSERKTKI